MVKVIASSVRKGNVLEVDGKLITQSNTINRYVGKLAGLYPKDDWQAALVDEVMDAVEDVATKISNTMALEGEAKKKARDLAAAAVEVKVGQDKLWHRDSSRFFCGTGMRGMIARAA